ncbi:ATP-binding cassette domain-containing protein [Oenococcus sicerae]|uniref:ATP-binding cassette domain-containing protein n=1 Tax=Oenococcus sicerae TaxID=2203724 RepID=UPI0039E8EDD7
MRKYIDKKWFALAILTAGLYGLEMPFNVTTYSYIFYILEKHLFTQVLPFIAIMLFGNLLLVLCYYANQLVINKNAALFSINLKTASLQALTEDDHKQASDKTSFVLNDLALVETNYFRQLISIVGLAVGLVLTFIFSAKTNFNLTLIFLFFSGLSQIVPKYFKKNINDKTALWSKTNENTTTFLNDLFKNAKTVIRYAVLKNFVRLGKKNFTLSEFSKKNRDNSIVLSSAVVYAVAEICQVLPIGAAMYFVVKGNLAISDFVAVQYSANWIMNQALQLGSARSAIASTESTNEKVLALIKNAEGQPKSNSAKQPTFTRLQVSNLVFKYPHTKEKLLDKLSFELKVGEKLLITGLSGAGKSTLLKIMIHELQADSGQVTCLDSSLYAFVSQETAVFNGSLKFNLTLGNHFSDQQLHASLTQAGFAKADLTAQVSESGSNFSGGQKKRIELARAFLFDRPLLIIDEGTASLDPTTANDIHERILASSKSVIEVDHHMPNSLIDRFDKKIVIG